jgi:hypothetical protein
MITMHATIDDPVVERLEALVAALALPRERAAITALVPDDVGQNAPTSPATGSACSKPRIRASRATMIPHTPAKPPARCLGDVLRQGKRDPAALIRDRSNLDDDRLERARPRHCELSSEAGRRQRKDERSGRGDYEVRN